MKQNNYKELFLRARASIEHHVIFDRQCKARPLSSTIPKDLPDIFGPRLPDALFYLLSQNVLSALVRSLPSVSFSHFQSRFILLLNSLGSRKPDERSVN